MKFTLQTGHEDPEGEYMYSSTLSLTSVLRGEELSTPLPDRFTPGKDPVPILLGWVGTRAGLYGCGKSRLPPRFYPRAVQPLVQSLYRLS